MSKRMRPYLLGVLCALLVLAVLSAVLQLTAVYDNKYTAGPPYGENGVFAFTEQDLERPLFLVDGWRLSVDGGAEAETFIGQYSNFAFPERAHRPFGSAVYRISLRCPSTHALMLELPEIFTEYTLFVDGKPIATNDSGSLVSFLLTDQADLTLAVQNDFHYYSGLYYPPALGIPEQIAALANVRTALYAVFCAVALTLAVFSAVLWLSRARDGLFLHFGVLLSRFFCDLSASIFVEGRAEHNALVRSGGYRPAADAHPSGGGGRGARWLAESPEMPQRHSHGFIQCLHPLFCDRLLHYTKCGWDYQPIWLVR